MIGSDDRERRRDVHPGPMAPYPVPVLVIRADLGSGAARVTGEKVQVVESYMFAHTGADDVPDHS